jgi:hypothetical protein
MVLSKEQRRRAAPCVPGELPHPSTQMGYSVAQKDLHRLQPLHDVIQRLLQSGMIGTDLL